jgi:hypothetical protein
VQYLILSVLGYCVDGSKLRYLYSPLAVSNSLLQAACIGSRENTETEELIGTREGYPFGNWDNFKPENCSSESSAPRSFRRDVGKTSRTYGNGMLRIGGRDPNTPQIANSTIDQIVLVQIWTYLQEVCHL